MSLFPPAPYGLYDDKDREITARMEAFHDQVISNNAYFWGEANLDTLFEAGSADLWNSIYGVTTPSRRNQFTFNRIRKIVNNISGYQRRNRKSTIVIPVENGDAITADQYSKILLWINQQENVSETISDAFQGALVTGMNLLHVWVDYRADCTSGNIKVDNCSYNTFLIDPYFKKRDLSDCTGIWKRSFLTKQECINLLPDHKDVIEQLPESASRDGKFNFMPELLNLQSSKFMAYDEFYYRDYRECTMLIDTVTGETEEWRSSNKDALKQFLALYPQITTVKREVPTVKVAIIVQGKCLYDDKNPSGTDLYPFVPVLAYYNPQITDFRYRCQGVVRGLRDAQYLYNTRKGIELDILQSQVNSGWIYKEDALVDPNDVFMTGQGKGIALKKTATMADVQQIQSPAIPPSTMMVSESLGKEIQELSGLSEENMGSSVDDVAGIISMMRTAAGLTTLQGLYDQLDFSQRLLGRIFIDIIQSNFTPGKVKRIIEQEPSPQFYNKTFGKYDAAVEEGFNTSTQRQMQFAQLIQLRELGVPIPDAILVEACTLQDKKKLTDLLEQQQQAQQQQAQHRAEVETQEIEARINLANSRAAADIGLRLERESRVQTNQSMAVERIAEAAKDENISFLNMVKALKELDTIDIDQVHKMIELQGMIKAQEQVVSAEAASKGGPIKV